MIKQLKNNFVQGTLGSLIWLIFLTSLSYSGKMIPFNFIWRLIIISCLLGLVFGVIYPYLWEYATFKTTTNIITSSLLNSFCGFLSVYLYSIDMFLFIKPYLIYMVILTIIGHTLGFYFYSKYDNKKQAKELNELI